VSGRVNKELTAFRFFPKHKNRLARFAKRKNVTMTQVMEGLIERFCLTPKEEKNDNRKQ